MDFNEAIREVTCLTAKQLEAVMTVYIAKEKVKETIMNTYGACYIINNFGAMKDILLEELELIEITYEDRKVKEEEDRLPIHYFKEDNIKIYCPRCFAKQMFTFNSDTDFKDGKGKMILYTILTCSNCKKRYKLIRYKGKKKVDRLKQIEGILRGKSIRGGEK